MKTVFILSAAKLNNSFENRLFHFVPFRIRLEKSWKWVKVRVLWADTQTVTHTDTNR
jgi:hypothetical protein